MSDTILYHSQTSGLSPVYLVWDGDGQVWNTSVQAFQAYVTATRANYETAMTEEGTASKTYTAFMDANIPTGDYSIEIREAVGEASNLAAVIDRVAWNGADFVLLTTTGIVDGVWDEARATHTSVGTFGEGTPIAPDGLDGVDTSDPLDTPGNFTERMNWLFSRFGHQVTLTETTLTVFDAASASAVTVQTVSNDGVIETQGKAVGP